MHFPKSEGERLPIIGGIEFVRHLNKRDEILIINIESLIHLIRIFHVFNKIVKGY
jgi:hypothetical protein